MPIKSLLRPKRNSGIEKKDDSAPGRNDLEGSIDFPREGDTVLPGHYAVRISAKSGSDVEISTGGDWQACREAVGYFWFDWWPTKPGRTTLSLRTKMGKGKWKKVGDRTCTVIGGATS